MVNSRESWSLPSATISGNPSRYLKRQGFMRSVILALVLLGAATAPTQIGPADLQPFESISPSGSYRLFANPSDRFGKGTSTSTLTHNGVERYKITLPYALQAAEVSDDGKVCGFGYVGGAAGGGAIVIVLLDPTGKVIFNDQIGRDFPSGFHMPHTPVLTQFERIDGTTLIRVRAITGYRMLDGIVPDEWWLYDFENPKKRQVVPIEAPPSGRLLDSHQVKGTGLDLLRWATYSDDRSGYIYTLTDRGGKTLWSLAFPTDLSKAAPRHKDSADEMQTVRIGESARTFELHLLGPDQRVGFRVEDGPGRISVTETSRVPFVERGTSTTAPNIPQAKLVAKSAIDLLGAAGSAAEPTGVGDFFFFDDKIVYHSGREHLRVINRSDGKPIRKIALPTSGSSAHERVFARVGRAGLIVFDSISGNDIYRSEAVKIDLSTGKRITLSKMKEPAIKVAVGFPDGRFVVASEEVIKSAIHFYLDLLDANGKRIWRVLTGMGGEDEGQVDSVDSLFITAKGEIGCLDNISKTISFLDQKGRLTRKVYLEKLWASNDSYLTSASAAPNGDIFLLDFADEGSVKKIASSGKLLGQRPLKYKDGKAYRSAWPIQTDPKGQVWVTDGRAIIRLAEDGTSSLHFGPPVVTTGLAEISQMTINHIGFITAFDGQTAELHRFDPEGKSVFVTRTLKEDYPSRPIEPEGLYETKSGDIYVGDDWMGNPLKRRGYLHFAANGQRVGWQSLMDEAQVFTKFDSPSPTWRWQKDRLIDENGRTVHELDRWPDLRWRDDSDPLAAPDGSLAVIGTPGYRSYRMDAGEYMAFYTPNGTPQGMVKLSIPLESIYSAAFDGETVYVLLEKELRAIGRDGETRWRADVRGHKVFFTAKGLAVWDGKGRVTWYGLPTKTTTQRVPSPILVRPSITLPTFKTIRVTCDWLSYRAATL